VAWAVVVAGCTLRAPVTPVRRPATADVLLANLEARRTAVTSLRGRARVRAGLGSVWTRQAVVVRRPDAVRIDVFSPFGLALALGARGMLLWAYPPAEGAVYEGPASPENVTRFLGAPVAVPDVVDILLGVPPARSVAGTPELGVTRDGEYELTLPLADGVQTLWFSGDTLAVLRAEERQEGIVVLRVTFDDYRDGFPYSVEVQVPARGGEVRLAYDSVEPNASIEPALFAPPAAPRVLPLEAAEAPVP
jgi:hypothetical protein